MAAVIGRRGLAGLGGAALGALAQFVLVVVMTRAYPAAEAGAFFTATALALMVSGIAKLDAGNGLIYFIARAKTYSYLGISGYIRAALVPCALAAAGAAVVLYPRLGPLAALLPIMVVADVLLAATRGFGVMRPTVLLDGVLVPVGQVLLVGGAAWAGVTGWGLTAAWGRRTCRLWSWRRPGCGGGCRGRRTCRGPGGTCGATRRRGRWRGRSRRCSSGWTSSSWPCSPGPRRRPSTRRPPGSRSSGSSPTRGWRSRCRPGWSGRWPTVSASGPASCTRPRRPGWCC
ncbi:hypothetical protein ACFQ0B_18510 [Nonomuraea thailandensis]